MHVCVCVCVCAVNYVRNKFTLIMIKPHVSLHVYCIMVAREFSITHVGHYESSG